jgi:hypothetical protein
MRECRRFKRIKAKQKQEEATKARKANQIRSIVSNETSSSALIHNTLEVDTAKYRLLLEMPCCCEEKASNASFFLVTFFLSCVIMQLAAITASEQYENLYDANDESEYCSD